MRFEDEDVRSSLKHLTNYFYFIEKQVIEVNFLLKLTVLRTLKFKKNENNL